MNRKAPSRLLPAKARCRQSELAERTVRVGSPGWLAVPVAIVAMLSCRTNAQEIPRPSFARQKQKSALPSVSNFRIGEVLMRVDAQVATQFVDNVDLSRNGKSDIVVTPEIGVNATWAVTKLNTLRFRAAIGYAYYFNSPNLNRQTMTISPDSALSFDVYAGDVKVNFHNQFSLQQETISQGTLSGVATLNRFTNTAGVSVLWDTNDIVWTTGYDHHTFITLGGANSSSGSIVSTISNLDHSTDQLSASMAVKISSALIGGFEATAAYSDYPKQTDSNFSSISAGPFFEMQLTKYTHAFLSGGYKGFFSGANAVGSVSVSSLAAAQPSQGDPSGFYANLSFVHRLNRFYSDRLEFGHKDDVEGLSGHLQTNFVRYSGNWRVNQKLSIGLGLYFDDVRVLSGSALGGSGSSDFQRVGGSISTGFMLSEHVGMGISYGYVRKEAQDSSQSYSQNSVTISLGYRF